MQSQSVAFFGFLWGPTGMLLSVPLVAYLKVALLSDKVPPRYRDPVLVFLEGDRGAPAKHARQRLGSAAQDTTKHSDDDGNAMDCGIKAAAEGSAGASSQQRE
mmetsp:Transcript_64204/g.149387  ORF Transcript_64204/g.149387 Transcript_64204/m.149387 type:complete len:103 (-) Transcript_64204:87-395(-)